MSLTKDQIQDIELYLEQKKLYELDVKMEVIDHFANGIEHSMNVNEIDFLDAFDIECLKWENDLKIYTSFLFTHNESPRIVAKKGKKEERKILIAALVFAVFVTILSFLFKTSIEEKIDISFLNKLIGYSYLFSLICIIFFYFSMTKTRKKSTYRGLFIINLSGFFPWFFLFNPLWSSWNNIVNNESLYASGVFINAFLLCFSFSFFSLYRKHMRFTKFVIA